MFGMSLNDAPTVNLFTGANDGRLVGTPASVGLVGGPMATVFNGATVGSNLLTVTGTVSGDPLVVGQCDVQTFGRDSAAAVVNISTGSGFANGATTRSLGVSEFNTTAAQGFIQRSGPARSAAAFATMRAANSKGSTTKKLRGHLYTSTTPAATIAGIAIYTKILSSMAMDDVFNYWRDILSDAGEIL